VNGFAYSNSRFQGAVGIAFIEMIRLMPRVSGIDGVIGQVDYFGPLQVQFLGVVQQRDEGFYIMGTFKWDLSVDQESLDILLDSLLGQETHHSPALALCNLFGDL